MSAECCESFAGTNVRGETFQIVGAFQFTLAIVQNEPESHPRLPLPRTPLLVLLSQNTIGHIACRQSGESSLHGDATARWFVVVPLITAQLAEDVATQSAASS